MLKNLLILEDSIVKTALSAIGNWFTDMIRNLFFSIDSIIYDGISKVYDLFETLSRVSIMSHGQIANFGERIYELLAIFMVFKVTISLITYVVNPDSFNDKSKGVGPLTRNVVLVLALLVLTPYFFTYAYKFQTMVLADNIIPKLIFGDESSNSVSSGGETMSFIAMNAFFYPDPSIVSGCIDLTKTGTNGVTINESCHGYTITNSDNPFPESTNTEKSGNVTYDTLAKVVDDVHADGDDTFKAADVGNYVTGFEHKNSKLAFRQRLITAKTPGGAYVFDYSYLLSTAVGVVILLLLVGFCMDIGVRSIKLAFLQMVAPIPIISYIDPNGGKDGMFKKWYKECFGTYLSLFIRLFVIYFVIYIVGLIGNADLHDMINGTEVTGFWLKLFVLIGALIFAKQFPKLLENLGLKMNGGFTLNPFRKIEKEALGGGVMKKPADLFNKAAKFAAGGALINGASTLGKKAIGGVYSAANGRGFGRGWRSVDSPFSRMINKTMDNWAPDFAKDRKEARVAKINSAERERQRKKGEDLLKTESKENKNREYDILRKIDPRYAKLWQEVNEKKGIMYDTNAKVETWKNLIAEGKLTAKQRKVLAEKMNCGMNDDDLIKSLNKIQGTAKKQYEYAEERLKDYGQSSMAARRAKAADDAIDINDKLTGDPAKLPSINEVNSSDSEQISDVNSSAPEQSPGPSIPTSSTPSNPTIEIVNSGSQVGRRSELYDEQVEREVNTSMGEIDDRVSQFTTSNGNNIDAKTQRRVDSLKHDLEDLIRARATATTNERAEIDGDIAKIQAELGSVLGDNK